MNEHETSNDLDPGHRDPLGLGDLPLIDPPGDGWAGIEAALSEDRRSRRRRLLGGIAVAASLVAVVSVMLLRTPVGPTGHGEVVSGVEVAETTQPVGSTESSTPTGEYATTVTELVALSQLLEQRLRHLRNDTGAMPAESVIYVTELEDLVARVDHELSITPESVELWSQRVNLLLDLEALFQHQFETEYGRMASL
jgi:hypothetical protein